MKIAIISGSHRENSQSYKVSQYIDRLLQQKTNPIDTYVFDLANNPLALWDESVWNNGDYWQQHWQPIATELQSCEGLIVVSPEWSGMVPAGLKNFFLLTSKQELGHKPGLIVTVSSGYGGAYPVNELRTSSYKNTYLCYIPDHVIIRFVEKMLNNDAQAESEEDQYIRQRLAYATDMLIAYSNALTSVRESGTIDFKTYPFGM